MRNWIRTAVICAVVAWCAAPLLAFEPAPKSYVITAFGSSGNCQIRPLLNYSNSKGYAFVAIKDKNTGWQMAGGTRWPTQTGLVAITEEQVASCLEVDVSSIENLTQNGADTASWAEQKYMGFSFTLTNDASSLAAGYHPYYIGLHLSSVGIASNNSTNTQAVADDVVTLTFTASEAISIPVVTFQSGGAAITDTSVTYANTSGNTWTAAYTVNASDTSGAVSYSIAFSDTAGNAGPAVTSSGFVTASVTASLDTTAPTMTITASEVIDGDTSNDGTLSLTFTSSEATTDFAEADITVSGGALSSFSATSSTVYTATFTPSGAGATTIDVAGGAFTDAVGNSNTAATQFNWTYDSTAPTMTITAAEISDGGTSNDGTLSLTFTSSESTSNFLVGDITVNGGTLSSFSGSGTTYTATFTPSGAGATTIDVASSKFTDAAGNNNTAATQFNWTYDTTAACTVNGQDYRTIYDTSGTYITLDKLTDRAGSWNNSTDLVMKCDVSQFTSMYRAFRNNSSFNQDISAWDVSNVTNMNGMFQSATSLTSVSFSDTSNVTNMSFMFANTTNLTSVSLSDTSNVTDMSYMFYIARVFNADISSWNTSKVTNMKAMFQAAESFNGNISSWNTSNVTDMFGMFSMAYAFNQNISNWDTSNVTDMNTTFERASVFNQDLSNWNTSKVTDMAFMFSYAVAFNQDISGWDTSNVTDMEYMFYKDAAFNQDIGNWDTSNVTNMTLMFSYAVAFNQNIRRWNVSSVTAFTDMFTNATLMQNTYSGVTGFANTPTSSWFDSTVPKMVITASQVSDGDTSNDGTLSMTFTSSEATSNFEVGDITVVGGALSNFAASSSTVYTATFTPTASGVTTIDVANAAFTDLVGNNNSAASQFNWTYDGTAPTLSSVSIATNNAITSVANDGDVITLTLTASETINTPVVTFKSGGAAITDTSVTYTNASGNTWTAAYTANASDTFGAVTFSIAYSDTVGNAGTITSTTDSSSVSFMPTPSAAFAAVKADVESKMAANARTQLNDFTTSTSSIVGSARSRFMNTSGVADSSDTALNGDVSSNGSDLKGSTKRVTSTDDGKNTSIVEVQYQYTETKEGLKSQNASGQIINEAKLSDSLTFGRFLGATLGDGDAAGTNNIDIDFMGAQAGAYLVGNTKGGLVYYTYFAGSVIENKMGVTTSLMTADTKYYSSMLTTGASITGTLQVKKVEIRPTLSTDLSYMFRETADFNVKVGSATSVEQAAYGDISKAQITFAPEFRLPFGEGSVITATPNVMCRYLKQGTATEDCGQGLSLGFRSTSKDGLLNLTAKAGMDRIGNETTSSLRLQFEHKF